MSKQKLFAALCGAALMTFAQASSARDFPDIYTECGLGAMIAPNNAAVAAVTNVIWDLGTTAISSNVSSADTCKGTAQKTAAYIFQSYAQLENDLAAGQGVHLAALMNVAGCGAASHTAVAASLRSGFATVASAPGYAQQTRFEKSNALFNQLQTRTGGEFAAVCTAV
jgi:Protein of unknown function (DUF3015)